MLNIEISETGKFMSKLLIENTFDTFLMVESSVMTNATYNINGRINKSFFDEEEMENLPSKEYVTWGSARPHIYILIRGKKLPLSLKIVLILSDANILRIIEKNNLTIAVDDVANLSLNIYYDGEKVMVTTVASMNAFSMDKTLSILWDENVSAFFKQNMIA